jgi:hypothetical protein
VGWGLRIEQRDQHRVGARRREDLVLIVEKRAHHVGIELAPNALGEDTVGVRLSAGQLDEHRRGLGHRKDAGKLGE